MTPVGFETTTPAGERPQTYALFRYLMMLIIEWNSAEFIEKKYICGYANTEHYKERVLNLIFVQVCEQNCWFLKGGVTAHTANETCENLCEFFGDHFCRNVGVFERICERQNFTHYNIWNIAVICAFQGSLRDRNVRILKKESPKTAARSCSFNTLVKLGAESSIDIRK